MYFYKSETKIGLYIGYPLTQQLLRLHAMISSHRQWRDWKILSMHVFPCMEPLSQSLHCMAYLKLIRDYSSFRMMKNNKPLLHTYLYTKALYPFCIRFRWYFKELGMSDVYLLFKVWLHLTHSPTLSCNTPHLNCLIRCSVNLINNMWFSQWQGQTNQMISFRIIFLPIWQRCTPETWISYTSY